MIAHLKVFWKKLGHLPPWARWLLVAEIIGFQLILLGLILLFFL